MPLSAATVQYWLCSAGGVVGDLQSQEILQGVHGYLTCIIDFSPDQNVTVIVLQPAGILVTCS